MSYFDEFQTQNLIILAAHIFVKTTARQTDIILSIIFGLEGSKTKRCNNSH